MAYNCANKINKVFKIFIKDFLFILLGETERAREQQEEGAEREGEEDSLLSREPNARLNPRALTEIMT